jgi:hypothetical protein
MRFLRNEPAVRNRGLSKGRILSATAVVLMLSLPLIVIPARVLSQAVQLVKVDVSVVGKGLPTSKLLRSSVVNDKNEKIGSLDDIIIADEHSLFAVLQVGGFLGIGSRLVAVPYDSLHIEEKDGKVQKVELPGATSDELKRLTEFKYPS